MKFTDEQLQAIETRGNRLLVSAAAGSGKTAVLVERIIRRILDEDSPIDIDRMLVMTFTKAAAAQMKEKIVAAIEQKRALKPDDPHLVRQAALVHNARITTIHGFCLDVIRDHFQEIGLDPGFRVADEGECRLLMQAAVEKVIERAYEEESEDFVCTAECLAAGKNDGSLDSILGRLYEFSMSDPDPERWLDKCISTYEDISVETIDDKEWMKVILDNALLIIKDAREKAGNAYDISTEEGGPYMYAEAVMQDEEMFDRLLGCTDYEGIRNALLSISWAKLGRAQKTGPEVYPELQEYVKDIRKDYKASAGKLIVDEFALTKEEQVRRIKACVPVVRELVRLTREVSSIYAAAKRDRNVVDFSDLEHMCIRILAAEDGETARGYRDFFEEIYVDEYQDSNLVQEELLNHIAGDDNLFMVGDVKQSIYSFRLARPQLFMAKYAASEYAPKAGTRSFDDYPECRNLKIDLHHNFRSRSSVLAPVNELFAQIMKKELGGIEYDDAAKLRAGAGYPETDPDITKGELILVTSEKGINPVDLEARMIAARIRRLMKEMTVYDPTDEEPERMRPVRYSDIVILLRSAKGWDERFKRVLAEEDIPVHVMSRTGYFSAHEISVILDYLNVLDNPLQDIPMAAVLRSAFGGFDDEELALLRSSYPAGYLYDSLTLCTDTAAQEHEGEASRIWKKASAFLGKCNEMRDKLGYTPVDELLREIIDGEYGAYISSLPDGRRKRANLGILLKKAEDYGKTSYKGLFHFIKYIEMLKKYEVDYGEANVFDENDDAVRIMTIHKSKGLEFPVCIVAGLHKQYNMMDAHASIIPDIDIGIGLDHVDPVRRVRYATALRNSAMKKKLFEIQAEEERVLYVAMTRAKEKLIMTAVVKDAEKALKKNKGVARCTSFLDLLLNGLNNEGLPSLAVSTFDTDELVNEKIHETVNTEMIRTKLSDMVEGRGNRLQDENSDLSDILKKRFSYRYPYSEESNMFEKVSVTELKRRSLIEKEDIELPDRTKELFDGYDGASEYIPDFILEQEKEIPATLHGTAVHRILELWDYDRGKEKEDILTFFDHVRHEGLMTDEMVDSISVGEISGFLGTPLAARMEKAFKCGRLYREQPFIFGMDGILVQGIIDAWFLEDDEIVIVDYKTDRVDDIDELAERYHVQLEYYAKALSSMLDKPVRDLIIYSTRHKNTVKVACPVLN